MALHYKGSKRLKGNIGKFWKLTRDFLKNTVGNAEGGSIKFYIHFLIYYYILHEYSIITYLCTINNKDPQ